MGLFSKTVFTFIFMMALFAVSPANAYIGPGVGLSAIGVFVGVVFSVFMLLLGLLWYPIKSLYAKIKAR